MGFSVCRGSLRNPHPTRRMCDYCDGCPVDQVGPLRTITCGWTVTYANGAALPLCGESHVCAGCRPKAQADAAHDHTETIAFMAERASNPHASNPHLAPRELAYRGRTIWSLSA